MVDKNTPKNVREPPGKLINKNLEQYIDKLLKYKFKNKIKIADMMRRSGQHHRGPKFKFWYGHGCL